MDLESLLGAIQRASQPRPDLVTPGATGVLENPRLGTFMGRMVTPQDTLASVMARLPQGETESGSLAIESPAFLASISPAFVQVANRTARASGAVGGKALVPRHVESTVPKDASILDFGSGPAAAHSQSLRQKGFTNVTAYDFGANVKPGVHDPQALTKQYDHVFASNVLNVQSSPEMLQETIKQIRSTVRPGGKATVNLPSSPRKFEGLNAELVQQELESAFDSVKRVGGTKSAPVFELTVKE